MFLSKRVKKKKNHYNIIITKTVKHFDSHNGIIIVRKKRQTFDYLRAKIRKR